MINLIHLNIKNVNFNINPLSPQIKANHYIFPIVELLGEEVLVHILGNFLDEI